MKALHRKLLRDLRLSWAQVLSITSVLAAGIASLVALQGTMYGLDRARTMLYAETGFADAEARLDRAPEAVLRTLARIRGVRAAESRVVVAGTLPRPGDPLPPMAALVSMPSDRPDALNRLLVLRGRVPERGGEALLLAKFAEKYKIGPGDRMTVLARGTRHEFQITGIATSAEYVVARATGGGMGGS